MSHDGLPIMLAVRLVDIDFDSTVPEPEVDPTHSPLTGKRLQRVPVIRVFGATPRGQKTCLHVHGVFRYFFVPYPGDLCGEDDLQQHLKALAEELDEELAANAALVGKDGKGRGDEGSNGERRGGGAAWVYDMTIVRLTPFYGYHEEAPASWPFAQGMLASLPSHAAHPLAQARPFIRVAMVLPHAVDKAAKLFARGFRARLPLQPHEAHIPYLLQFKVDHNLLGMEFVQLAHASWRGLLPATTAATPLGVASPHGSWTAHPGFRNVWKRGTTGGLDANSPLPRVASTELEADCDRQHILNARDVLHEPIRSARRDVRLVQSLNQIWADEEQRRRANGMPALTAEAATPASEVARRTRLPPPPPEVERELEVLEANLRQPLPVPARTAPPEQRRPTPLWSLAAEGPARGADLHSPPGDNPTSHSNMEGDAGCGDAANTAAESIGDSEGRSDATVGSLGDLLALEEQGAVSESRSRADAAQSSQLGQQSPHSGPSLGSLLSEMCSKRPGEEMDAEIYRSGGASQAESHQDASSYSQVTSEHRRPQGEANAEGEFAGFSRASTNVDDYAATSLPPQFGSSQPCAQGLEHGDAPEDDDMDGEQEECHTHDTYTFCALSQVEIEVFLPQLRDDRPPAEFAAPQGDPADGASGAHSYAKQAWRREAAECVERHVRAVVGVHGVSVSEHTGTVMVEAISTSMNNTSQIVHGIRRVIQGIGLLVEESVEDLEGDIAASQALIEHELSGGRNDDECTDARDEITARELELEGGAASYSDDDNSATRLLGVDQQNGVRDVEANSMYEEWVENVAHSRERLRRAMSTTPFAEPTTTAPDVAVADEESPFVARARCGAEGTRVKSSRDAVHAQADASTHGEESRLAERKRLYDASLAFSKRAKPETAAAQVNAGLPAGEDSQPYVRLRQAGMTKSNLESSFEYGDGGIIGGCCNVCRGTPSDICTSQVNDAVIANGSTQSSNQEQFGKSPSGAVAPSASVCDDRPAKVVDSPSPTCTPKLDDNPPSPRVPSPKYDNFQDMHKTRVRQGDDRHESDEDGEADFAMPTTEQPHHGITTSSHSLAAGSISDSLVNVLVPWVAGSTPGAHVWTPRLAPPTRLTAAAEVNPRVRHQEPFFSSKRDLPKGGVRVAHNRIFRFEVPELEGLCAFNCALGPGLGCSCSRLQLRPPTRVAHRVLTPVLQPPSVSQVAAWLTKYAPDRLPQEDPSRERQAPVGVNREADQPVSATQQNAKTMCVVQSGAISESASAAGTNEAPARRGELAAQVECLATAAATEVGQSPSNKKRNETIHPRSKNINKTIAGQNCGITQISAPTATHNSAPYLSGDTAELHSCQSLTIMCFEVHVRTKGSMMPNMGQTRATDDADMGGLPDLHVANARDPAVSATPRNERPEFPNGAAPGDELLCIAYAVQHDLPASDGCESESPGKRKTSSSSNSGLESSAVGGVRYGLILQTDHETEAHGAQEGARLRSFLGSINGFQVVDDEVTLVRSEAALLQAFAKVVHRHDVDLVLSWDARRRSIGMLIERADNIGIDPPLLRQLGRTPNMTHRNEKFEDLWGERVQSGIHIVGRLVVNVWRCAQQELPLCSYTLENVAHRLLQERVPAYSHETLTRWWDHGLSPPHSNRDGGKHRVLQYYLQRVRLCLRVADAMEVVPRTSELARVFGLDFMSVLTRGSQYRVESMLCRLARAQGFVIPSPDKSQVASQPALQCLPLILEPEGRFYTSPVIVLDFRSLYPSVIIAYNYCYSTCLGRISNLNRQLDPNDDGRGAHRFGALELSARGFCTEVEAQLHASSAARLHSALNRLKGAGSIGSGPHGVEGVHDGEHDRGGPRIDVQSSFEEGGTHSPHRGSSANRVSRESNDGQFHGQSTDSSSSQSCGLHASPNGVLFTTSKTRPGILPRLLQEILDTRVMVKRAMKQLPAGSSLHRTLNARQFGLKLIANVTYGYTSASFSGRLPNVHIADAIVQTGRETLSRTIHMVNNHPTWGARGEPEYSILSCGSDWNEFTRNVAVVYGDTDSLFVLLEGRSRQEAFETGKKIAAAATAANPHPMELELEKVYHPCVLCTKKRYAGFMYEHVGSLPKLDCKGIETVRRDGCPAERKVKSYLLRQCDKILAGRVSEQDFIFATEVKLGHYASDATAPPAAQVAMHRQKLDPNDVVQVGERVPYVVVNMLDSPIYKLRESAQRPEHLLFPRNSRLELNAFYYIVKRILPAVDRVFSLIGVDVFHWYKLELKRSRRNPLDRVLPGVDRGQRGTILGHFESDHCVLYARFDSIFITLRTCKHFSKPYRSQHLTCASYRCRCDERCKGLLCGECYRDRGRAFCALSIRQQKLEMRLDSVIQTCIRCCSAYERQVECISLDCPRLFTRLKLQRQLQAASCHIEEATNLLDF